MGNDYRIQPAGTQFIVIDPWGEAVNTYAGINILGTQSVLFYFSP